MQEFLASDLFTWVIFPLLIILARVLDVTLGTLRIIFVSRGNRIVAPILGFFEVLIWIIAISQIMNNIDNPVSYVAYALGFSIGNYLGIQAEEKLAIGLLIVQIFVSSDEEGIKKKLIEAGYGVTSIQAQGSTGDITILYSVIKRKSLKDYISIITEGNPNIFYSVETAREAHMGIYPKKNDASVGGRMEFLKKLGSGFPKRK